MMARPVPHGLADYPHARPIGTRWMDNDAYGHVNNVTYYSYFDTAVNEHLIRAGGLTSGHRSRPVVERVSLPIVSFPEAIDVGLRVVKLGTSSVKYEIGIFRQDDDEPAATGYFVHVWVDRVTLRPASLPPRVRAALEPLVVEAGG
jgi:acyl-CoA thioester hydrolase